MVTRWGGRRKSQYGGGACRCCEAECGGNQIASGHRDDCAAEALYTHREKGRERERGGGNKTNETLLFMRARPVNSSARITALRKRWEFSLPRQAMNSVYYTVPRFSSSSSALSKLGLFRRELYGERGKGRGGDSRIFLLVRQVDGRELIAFNNNRYCYFKYKDIYSTVNIDRGKYRRGKYIRIHVLFFQNRIFRGDAFFFFFYSAFSYGDNGVKYE